MRSKGFLLVILLAIAVGVMLFLPGCAGEAARSNVLLPTIAEMWTNLQPDALVAVSDPNDLNAMETAVSSGVGLTSAWTTAKPYVTAGIASQVTAGTMSSTLASSKTETVTQMTEAIAKYDDVDVGE